MMCQTMPNYISNVRMPSSLIYSSYLSKVDLRPALPAKRNPCRSAKPSTDCQLCPASDFLRNVQSDWIHVSFSKSKKNSWATFKRNILQILWDVQQLGSFYTRIYIYVCICIYMYVFLVTACYCLKARELIRIRGTSMWWWGRISAQPPLPGAFVLPNHQGQSSRHGLANYPGKPV
jgi:hypothetical protein